ncbi:hypothetical protein B5X24_HaOG216878 [Helicoverpa armigera]|uniref:Uncharacterized protein n=1 Tax=Helicoverpa armigera TaxID=29058 RepID=A0A2W1C4J3_HELAM|nr:hypothetical protein B5X24_HaOG216878 [Helicoverpa armigera]
MTQEKIVEDACTPLAEEAPLSGGGASAGAGEPRDKPCACAAWPPRRQPAPHEILRPKPRRYEWDVALVLNIWHI